MVCCCHFSYRKYWYILPSLWNPSILCHWNLSAKCRWCYLSDVSYLYICTTLQRNRFWHVGWITISSYNPIPNKQPLKLSLIVSVYYCTSISYFDGNITLFDHYCTFVTQFHYTRLVALWYFLFMHIVFVKTTTFFKKWCF